jgi:hypothetical protein
MAFEGGERFRAHVMFDAFGIHFCDAFGDAEATEEGDDSLVAALASARQSSPFVGEKNRAIRLRGNEPRVLKPRNSPIDGDMGHAEALGEVNDAGFANFCDQVGDGFDVILGNLVGVFAASLRKVFGLAFIAGVSFSRCLSRGHLNYPDMKLEIGLTVERGASGCFLFRKK